MLQKKLSAYAQIMRLNKPVGIGLLLWPTLWAIWVASSGQPHFFILSIFVLGVVLMRSAGCVINDYADRYVDGKVERTQHRPLPQGLMKPNEALILFSFLCLLAFLLVLQLNLFAIQLAVMGVILAIAYPFVKRFSYFPQLLLGIIFGGWPVLLAFAAIKNELTFEAWFLFLIASAWPIMYDTIYAMVDSEDDKKIGVKSFALWLGQHAHSFFAMMQSIIIFFLILLGQYLHLKVGYYITLFFAGLLFIYQQVLLKEQKKENYFLVFKHNNWFGLFVFLAFFLGY